MARIRYTTPEAVAAIDQPYHALDQDHKVEMLQTPNASLLIQAGLGRGDHTYVAAMAGMALNEAMQAERVRRARISAASEWVEQSASTSLLMVSLAEAPLHTNPSTTALTLEAIGTTPYAFLNNKSKLRLCSSRNYVTVLEAAEEARNHTVIAAVAGVAFSQHVDALQERRDKDAQKAAEKERLALMALKYLDKINERKGRRTA